MWLQSRPPDHSVLRGITRITELMGGKTGENTQDNSTDQTCLLGRQVHRLSG